MMNRIISKAKVLILSLFSLLIFPHLAYAELENFQTADVVLINAQASTFNL